MTAETALKHTVLEGRGVFAITGEDRQAFLQGLVSNDVRLATPERAIYAWFMTPQGKYLHDFIIQETGDALLLDVEASRRGDLMRRLKMYKLRSKVTLEDRSDGLRVVAVYGGDAATAVALGGAGRGASAPLADGWVAVDPRKAELGVRAILPAEAVDGAMAAIGAVATPFAEYDRLRLELAVPDSSRDLEPERALALENDMDALGAISWDKGCYMGQELTARTKYRGLVRRRLATVAVEGDSLPEPGTPILGGEAEVGELRGGADGLALALMRLTDGEIADKGAELTCGGAVVRVL